MSRIKKLRKELDAPIVNTLAFLIAVENYAMEDRWGLPLIRHNGKDWYDLGDVRRRMRDGVEGNSRKTNN